jgi:catechol 2,3-dioxygenase-like lactoylglutathione lyase family enzyme
MAIEIQGMSPLLSVFDMPTSLGFYRDILGFEVTGDSGEGDNSGWVMLRLSDTILMLNTQYEKDDRPTQPNPAHVLVHNDTCLYFDVPDPDAVHEYLRAHGLDIKPPKDAPYGMRQLHLHDPDGYNLCFQSPV